LVNTPDQLLDVGEIKAAYGVKGWVKVFSYTRPIEQIFSYKCWLIGKNADVYQLEDYDQRSNSGLIAKMKGIDDRTAALTLAGKSIAIYQSEVAVLDGEYYWSQIIGLNVFNCKGERLGHVSQMMETGANDVMVVITDNSELLIPYAESIVQHVELEAGRIVVDWETDY
jgi:16S rRNA processing protein RimM